MIFDDTGLVAFLFEMSFKAGSASLAVAWAHSLVISIFGSDIKHELAQQFIEQRRRNFFYVPEVYLPLKKGFYQAYVSVGLYSGVFVFLLIHEVISCLSRGANLGTSSILFWKKAVRLFPSTVKNYRLCLWLDERWIFTVIRFSDWLVGYSVRILRGLYA